MTDSTAKPEMTTAAKPLALLVDDEPTFLTALNYLLNCLGWNSVIATHAGDALRELNSRKFDLIILDVAMAEMDGIDLCLLIQQQFGNAAPPVFMLSGYIEQPVREAALRAGARCFINKPLIVTDFARTLKEHGLPVADSIGI